MRDTFLTFYKGVSVPCFFIPTRTASQNRALGAGTDWQLFPPTTEPVAKKSGRLTFAFERNRKLNIDQKLNQLARMASKFCQQLVKKNIASGLSTFEIEQRQKGLTNNMELNLIFLNSVLFLINLVEFFF